MLHRRNRNMIQNSIKPCPSAPPPHLACLLLPTSQVWELALADGRGSDVYEIVGVATRGGEDGRRKGSGGGSGAPHRAAFEVERRLRAELLAKEASPATEAQALVVRNFYSRRVWHCSFFGIVFCVYFVPCIIFCEIY